MTDFPAPGTHLLIDFWQASHLTDRDRIETALRDAAAACGATILHVILHEFGEGHGITGIALLAESHISIHTWPELNFAALDIFTCGTCDPYKTLPVLEKALLSETRTVIEHKRGTPPKPS